MRVLAFDTSGPVATVAVVVDGELASARALRVGARHGETLMPMIAEALTEAGLGRTDYDLLAVGVGPGSFTGTRVGVMTAKGLAVAADKPVVGVSSLEAIASAMPGERLVPAVDAHKGEVFVAMYERAKGDLVARLEPFHAPPEEAAARIDRANAGAFTIAGSGPRRYDGRFTPAGGRLLPPLYDLVRADHLAARALVVLEARGPNDRGTLEPTYLRPSDAALPKG